MGLDAVHGIINMPLGECETEPNKAVVIYPGINLREPAASVSFTGSIFGQPSVAVVVGCTNPSYELLGV